MSTPRAFVHHSVRDAIIVIATFITCVTLTPQARTTVGAQSSPNPIQQENAKPGTTDWKLTNPGWTSGVVEGYADVTSVNRGGQIRFYVNTSDPTYTIEFFRIGYYQGLGGRRMTNAVTLSGTRQTIPSPDPDTGLIECDWINPYVLTIPNTADRTDWMSGYYYAKLTSSSGAQWLITFVVRDDARASDLIMVQPVNTAQAYNVWGGKSLYGTIASRADTANKAMKVSFHRPYYGDETWGAGQFSAQNDFKFYDWGMVQFLEQNGYDVTYATSVDLDRDSNLLLNHKAFLSVGHDEYWSWQMRDNVEHARDVGINLGFFSANTSYWQVRYEDSPTTGDPSSVMVGYKEFCGQDPAPQPYLRTCRFRDPPVNRPEDQMIGVMYITQSRQPFVVEDASSWIFTGTGLKNGDSLVNPDGSYFVGYEVDAVGPDSPLSLQRVAHSPATATHANFSDMTVYRAASGATVFASGSILWTYAVPQIVQATKNVFARLINNAFADTIPIRPPLPAPFQAVDIGDVGRAGFVALAGPDSFTLDGAGQDEFKGNDALFYAYQGLTGDGSIMARITSVQDYWDNRAGLMIRESLAPDARYLSLVARPSDSRMNGSSGVNEGVEFKWKNTTGGGPSTVAQQDMRLPNWVRLTRTGNVFEADISSDGSTWTELGTTTLAMTGTIYIGASVASAQHGVWLTASVDHVMVVGGSVPPPPDTTPPAVSITAPASGATVSGTVSVTASASDDVAVAGVQFKLDGANLGNEVTSAPYSLSWSTTSTANGTHTLTALARDSSRNTATASPVSVTVSNAPPVLPGGWSHADIGAVGPAGTATYDSTSQTFTVTGAGADVWGTADAFHDACTRLTGDGAIVARVATISAGANWIKAGVMLRDTLDPSSADGFMLVSYAKGVSFQRRLAAGGVSTSDTVGGITAPEWVKVERKGNAFTASTSSDGSAWTVIGTDTIAMGSQIFAGLAVSSHTNVATATATFDNVSITTTPPPPPDTTPPTVSITTPASGATVSGTANVTATASDNVAVAGVQFKLDGGNLGAEVAASPYSVAWNTTTAVNGAHTLAAVARDSSGNTTTSAAVSLAVQNQTGPPPLPSGWTDADVGAVGPSGRASYDSTSAGFTVTGAGADVWGTADAFHYAYRPLTGDGTLVARVAAVSAGANWIKAGVMLRESVDPSSRQAFMIVSYAKGLAFQRRVSTAGVSTSTSGAAVTAPYWVKLTRSGNTFTASASPDGTSWTIVGSDTIAMGSQILAGLAVSSHANTATATVTFDHVSVVTVTVNNPTGGQCSSVTLSQTSFYSGGPSSYWSITVTAPSSTCSWTASINQSWLLLNGVTGSTTIAGSGSAVITLETTANTTGGFRIGTFTIAGTSYTVTQEK